MIDIYIRAAVRNEVEGQQLQDGHLKVTGLTAAAQDQVEYEVSGESYRRVSILQVSGNNIVHFVQICSHAGAYDPSASTIQWHRVSHRKCSSHIFP